MSNADALNEAERVRAEMHETLDQLDQARKAYAAGVGTMADVHAAAEKTHDVTERYFTAMRKALGTEQAA
jgi:hypothetical protein